VRVFRECRGSPGRCKNELDARKSCVAEFFEQLLAAARIGDVPTANCVKSTSGSNRFGWDQYSKICKKDLRTNYE
jgi:hypothetical protein